MNLNKKFVLGEQLTAEEIAFFDEYGFIHFEGFIKPDEIAKALDSIRLVEHKLIANNVEKVNGIPIKYGKDENGYPMVHRFAFASLDSKVLHDLINDFRIEVLKRLLPGTSRIGEYEKDGLVINHYMNTDVSNFTKLGWHTDGLRDMFQGFRIDPMLNVGISLDDSPIEKGGLRVIPGSHKQSFYDMLFRKKYFLDNNPDKDEFAIETKAGDLTVHHGRMWHRVALSPLKGAASRRRMMYFPIIGGKYKPKNGKSWTPIYHKFQKVVK